MALTDIISVNPDIAGDYVVPNLSKDAVPVINDVLKQNHLDFDIFFDEVGRHNHTMHHILTIYALGADANAVRDAFFGNDQVMQRPKPPVDNGTVESFKNTPEFLRGLGKPKNYSNYLEFFRRELRSRSYKDLLHEYYFKGDEKANTMFNRLFASVIHPFIHLGLALEFEQPALVAEALAETAVHEDGLKAFFVESERLAQSGAYPREALASIVRAMSADENLQNATKDSNPITERGRALIHQLDRLATYASKYRVSPHELDRANAESANVAAFLMAAAQRKDKVIKMDFFLMHCVTSSIFLSTFVRQDWISAPEKAKMIEWKARTDLSEYAAAACTKLYLDEITDYQPKLTGQSWEDIFKRAIEGDDDGHIAKTIRALAHATKICKPYETSDDFIIKGDKTWLNAANMVLDSAADGHEPGKIDHWIWGTGNSQSWSRFRNRAATWKY